MFSVFIFNSHVGFVHIWFFVKLSHAKRMNFYLMFRLANRQLVRVGILSSSNKYNSLVFAGRRWIEENPSGWFSSPSLCPSFLLWICSLYIWSCCTSPWPFLLLFCLSSIFLHPTLSPIPYAATAESLFSNTAAFYHLFLLFFSTPPLPILVLQCSFPPLLTGLVSRTCNELLFC